MNKTNETYVPLSRGLLEHLPDIPPLALKIYIYLLLRADFKGENKGKVRVCLKELANDTGIHPQTVWRTINDHLKEKYLTYKAAKNQYSATEYNILKYKVVNDFLPNCSKPQGLERCYSTVMAPLQQTVQTLEPQGLTSLQELKNKKKKNIYMVFANLWNKNAINPKTPKIATPDKLSATREKHIKLRLTENPDLEYWNKIFAKIQNLPFYCGDNDREWAATFDWIIKNDTNHLKILEQPLPTAKKETSAREVVL